jgi:hypothetical protein
VQQHAASFIARTKARTGSELPQCIKDEFDAFLECGILAHGFLRLRCGDCGHDKLLAFSCKRRGFCPSCSARRMSQTAAHLVDHVIRTCRCGNGYCRWPIPLRLLLAAQPELVTTVLQGFLPVILERRLEKDIGPPYAPSRLLTLAHPEGRATPRARGASRVHGERSRPGMESRAEAGAELGPPRRLGGADRGFQGVVIGTLASQPGDGPAGTCPVWSLLGADLFEDDEKVVVRLEAPGMRRDDVLAVEERTIVSTRERSAAVTADGELKSVNTQEGEPTHVAIPTHHGQRIRGSSRLPA